MSLYHPTSSNVTYDASSIPQCHPTKQPRQSRDDDDDRSQRPRHAIPLAIILIDATIDPIVHRLWLSLTDDDARRPSRCPRDRTMPTSDERAPVRPTDDATRELERLGRIDESLVSLHDALERVCDAVEKAAAMNTTNGDDVPSNRTRAGRHRDELFRRLNGIAVPLFHILQQPEQIAFHDAHRVLRSAVYSNLRRASSSSIVLWRLHSATIRRIEKDDDASARTLVLPCLVSCAVALSSLEVGECGGDGSAAYGETEENAKSRRGFMDGAMDRGEDCAVELLRLIRTVVRPNRHLDEEKEDMRDWTAFTYEEGRDEVTLLAKHIGNAMGGSLVARLVLGCLSLLNQEGGILDGAELKGNSVMLQIESLKTLRVILRSIPLTELWKSILPGCFAGLYRSALANLRYASVASAHKVASESVLVLALLLKQSLTTPSINRPKESSDYTQKSILSSLLQVVDRAKQASEPHDSNTPLSQSNEQIDSFGKEVNTRLPGPLTVLLLRIPNNRSRLVRSSGLYLSGVILTHAWHAWSDDTAKGMGRKALEYCLMLLTNDDGEWTTNINIALAFPSASVSHNIVLSSINTEAELKKSSQVLCAHRSLIGIDAWRLRLSKSIVPAILELIEMLPIFAKSGRDLEVCNHLRLINGYLLISFRDKECEFDVQECLVKKKKSDIGSAMSCPEAINIIKKSFAVLFTPDVNTIAFKPMIENGVSPDPNLIIPRRENRSFRFLYLLDETIVVAKSTVRLLACVLGAKRSAYLIDECFADVFQSCIRYFGGDVENVLPAEGKSPQLDWCGSCIFATEILAGMCTRDNDNKNTKRSKSEQHMLTSLTSSVLPVIVSHPLWTLPTSLQDETRIILSKPSNSEVAKYSTEMMRCDAVLLCTLMGFISQASHSLGEDMRSNLPIILLPLLERASGIGNHPSVQTCAFETISDIALSAGYSDIFSLLTSNFDYIMDHISLQLRKHSKERTPVSRSLMAVVDVVLRSVIRNRDDDGSNVAIVDHMLQCLLSYFDRVNDPTVSRIQTFDTICVLRSINEFMESSIDAQIKCNHDLVPLKSEDDGYDWLKKLDIELERNSEEYYDGNFYENTFNDDDVADVDEEPPPLATGCGSHDDVLDTTFVKEIASINEVLKRCAYLLCHPNLQMQVLCSVTLLSGFKSLGKIGAYRKSLRGESASNPLLPAIAEYWPSIVARLRSTSSDLHSKKMMSRSDLSIRQIMATDQDESRSETSLIVLLSTLLEIVSELCSISDGFFAGRFECDVYPMLAKLLGDCIPEEMQMMTRDRSQSSSFGERRHSALSPILICLKSVFQTSCRSALSGLISSCGTILLPLLSCKGQVGDDAMDVLKTMLTVDCDILWRPIHRLSGEPFPFNPMRHLDKSMDQPNDDCTVVCKKSALQFKAESCAIMSERAKELLLFIDELPEQYIF